MQVPAPVDYERASSIDEALALLERHGPEARLIAGGHSLLPMMKLRLARPEVLIDINDLTELAFIRLEGDELRIGAMARHRDLLESPVVGEHYRILHDAERVIADPVVRNRGTVGGSLCQADPSEDLSAAFAAVGASMVIRSSSGDRQVPADQFHVGPYTTAVGPAEMLVEIRLPVRPGCGSAYEKVERRVGDWPVVAVGACLWLDGGTVTDVGLGLAAVGAEHFRVPAAEDALRGGPASDERIAAAAAAAAAGCDPISDQRGPADYKRHLVDELAQRALRRAAARARGEEA
ncbi:MAG TPA: xanthine dehydrogenase family protein subunit M [Acidimicrobiales bacterium]|nr:xanthine dehydrogenase family protein subunit M [Acidimicrobiales bacterium]